MENTKYNAEAVKERLVEYQEFEKDIDNQIERLERLEIRLRSIGAPVISDMPKSPSSSQSRMADMIAQKLDLEKEIKQAVIDLRKERESIEAILVRLKHSDERAVIRLRYLDGYPWYDVADAMFGSKDDYLGKEDTYLRRTHKIHGSALVNMAIIIENSLNSQKTT